MSKFLKKNAMIVRIVASALFVGGVLLILIACFGKVDGKVYKGTSTFNTCEVFDMTEDQIEALGVKEEYKIDYVFDFSNNKLTVSATSDAFKDVVDEETTTTIIKDEDYVVEDDEIKSKLLVVNTTVAKKVGPFVGTYDLFVYATTLGDVKNEVVLINVGNIVMIAVGFVLAVASLTFEGMLCKTLYLKKKKH